MCHPTATKASAAFSPTTPMEDCRIPPRADRFPAAWRTPVVAVALVVSVAIVRGVLDPLWIAATRHPFLDAVREGTITDSAFILIVANDPGYMGTYVNGRVLNIAASVYLVVILAASLAAIPLMIVTGAGQ